MEKNLFLCEGIHTKLLTQPTKTIYYKKVFFSIEIAMETAVLCGNEKCKEHGEK